MHIAKAIGWSKGETPTVPQGMQVHALATGLEHPRFVYVLPNGDVLVVEANGPKAPINRPKDLIMGWVQNYAGTHAKGGNRIMPAPSPALAPLAAQSRLFTFC
jgi:glucose/arabinose dehydrogenase